MMTVSLRMSGEIIDYLLAEQLKIDLFIYIELPRIVQFVYKSDRSTQQLKLISCCAEQIREMSCQKSNLQIKHDPCGGLDQQSITIIIDRVNLFIYFLPKIHDLLVLRALFI